MERLFPGGLRVLVVDDDPLCILVVEKMLRRCGYTGTSDLPLFSIQAKRVLVERKTYVLAYLLSHITPLRRLPLSVTTATRGMQALALLRQNAAAFGALGHRRCTLDFIDQFLGSNASAIKG